jgi:hypothetical protein
MMRNHLLASVSARVLLRHLPPMSYEQHRKVILRSGIALGAVEIVGKGKNQRLRVRPA